MFRRTSAHVRRYATYHDLHRWALAKQYARFWKNLPETKPSPNLHRLVIRASAKSKSHPHLAMAAFTQMELKPKEHDELARQAFASFHAASAEDLLLLKHFYNSIAPSEAVDTAYIAAYIHVLLNSGLTLQAIRLYEEQAPSLRQGPDVSTHVLPTIRILDHMCSVHHPRLAAWLEHLILPPQKWLVYLHLGLATANYPLVKVVYDHFIMEGYETGISARDALFHQGSAITDTTIHQVLQLFARHGDVNLTLQLIESHFIHKSLKGERALTADLAECIVNAYCHHKASVTTATSVSDVLDVLDSFAKHETLSHHSFIDGMLFRYMNYHLYDRHIEHAKKKQLDIAAKLEDVNLQPRKVSNPNVHVSARGNALANLQTLERFINHHLHHMADKGHTPRTHSIFVNTLLHHIDRLQNLTGLIFALGVMSKWPGFHLWLNADSYLIILHSLSNLGASKLTGLFMLQHLQKHHPDYLTPQAYAYLLELAMRGSDWRPLFEYYLGQNLAACPVHPQAKSLLKELNLDSVSVDSLPKTPPAIFDDPLHAERRYYHTHDVNDVERLTSIFS